MQGVTAGALKTYVDFAVYDEDTALDDLVGSCSWNLGDVHFAMTAADPILFECPYGASQAGYELWFYVTPK